MGGYNNALTGTASFASAISFFGNKNITSGEGGAFITNDQEIYEFIKKIHSQGQSSKRFVHEELGYNYRMTNIQAAILCGQMDLIYDIGQMKYDVFLKYRQAFRDREDIKIQTEAAGTTSANWMFGVRVPGNSCYEDTKKYFKSHGIEIRPMFYSIQAHKHLLHHPDIFGIDYRTLYCTKADLLQKECFILPSFPELTNQEQTHIINVVESYLKYKG